MFKVIRKALTVFLSAVLVLMIAPTLVTADSGLQAGIKDPLSNNCIMSCNYGSNV